MSATAFILQMHLEWRRNPLTPFSFDVCTDEARKIALRLISGDY
jgi:hypothetical protein